MATPQRTRRVIIGLVVAALVLVTSALAAVGIFIWKIAEEVQLQEAREQEFYRAKIALAPVEAAWMAIFRLSDYRAYETLLGEFPSARAMEMKGLILKWPHCSIYVGQAGPNSPTLDAWRLSQAQDGRIKELRRAVDAAEVKFAALQDEKVRGLKPRLDALVAASKALSSSHLQVRRIALRSGRDQHALVSTYNRRHAAKLDVERKRGELNDALEALQKRSG